MEQKNNVLVLTRTIPAPIEKVFRAWTEKSGIEAWYGPESMTTRVDVLELKVGGRYRFTMKGPDGSEHVVDGVFKEIASPNKVSFTWLWEGSEPDEETTVTIELAQKGNNATELTLTQGEFKKVTGPMQSLESHQKGWSSSFNKLEKI
jgi:uncharacterized protein YndB with AHSA1/START domain